MNKKLIIFSYDFPPSDGGIARLCHEISVRATAYYKEVIILTRKKAGDSILYNKNGDIKIIEANNQRIKCEHDCYKYLKSIKNKNEYDVLCGLWHPEATIALAAGFKNIFVLAHGAELLGGKSLFRRYFWLPIYCNYVLRSVKAVIANSSYTGQLVKNTSKGANTTALPLAVNHTFFKPQNNKTTDGKLSICSVSRIHKFKGHDFVIRTISGLPEEFKNKIRYNIAGTGSYLPELKRMVNELDLNDIVKFHGFVPDKELPSFYNNNDLFILCTRESKDSENVEGFGLVFLEAQSCGIPAIGTRTGGIPDAVKPGDGGWLIGQDNTEELSEIIKTLIDDRKIVTEMGKKARERAENKSTWDIYCENLFKIVKG